MGKKRFRKKKNRDDPNTEQKPYESYDNCVKDNELFVKYYKAQNLIEDDNEFKLFLNTLREPLPACKFINKSSFIYIDLLIFYLLLSH